MTVSSRKPLAIGAAVVLALALAPAGLSPFLVQFLSRFMTLEPGDVVITGTPAGVGKLSPGDTYAITLEGVGTLTNPCIAERVTSSE